MTKKTILAFLCGIPLISCSIFGNSDYGFVRASVKFPDRSFNIKVIPNNTDTILVKVSGEGLTEPILFELTRENTSKLLKNVPQGDKQVNASAIDPNGNIIAKGQNSVNVIAQQLNTVEVELKLNDKINNSPSPEPVNCQIQLEEKDLPLPENLAKAIQEAGCRIIPKPTPTPTQSASPEPTSSISSSPTPTQENNQNFGSGSTGSNSNNVNSNINIIDGQQKDSPDIILNSNQP